MSVTAHPGSRAAIVTTLRNAGNVLGSFIAYHLALGFGRLYLFFDDPADPDLPRAAAHARVTAIGHDRELRERWRHLPQYSGQAQFLDREVMARQVLNTELAMELARADGFDWLLHIDSDELFYSPRQSVAEHFDLVEKQRLETVVYLNYEAAPDRDEIGDFFREVAMFLKKLCARRQPRRDHIRFFEENLALAIALQSRDPRFDRPNSIDAIADEQA